MQITDFFLYKKGSEHALHDEECRWHHQIKYNKEADGKRALFTGSQFTFGNTTALFQSLSFSIQEMRSLFISISIN